MCDSVHHKNHTMVATLIILVCIRIALQKLGFKTTAIEKLEHKILKVLNKKLTALMFISRKEEKPPFSEHKKYINPQDEIWEIMFFNRQKRLHRPIRGPDHFGHLSTYS